MSKSDKAFAKIDENHEAYLERREEQDDHMSPFDLAVESATEYERKFSMDLMQKHSLIAKELFELKAEMELVGQHNVRLTQKCRIVSDFIKLLGLCGSAEETQDVVLKNLNQLADLFEVKL